MTHSDDSPALVVEGLVKRFGTMTAVDGLDLRLERGRVMALLGPNGAGKTTTVEMCEGFLAPDDGTVRVLDLDPVRRRRDVRSRIGMMLQGGGAYPGARVGEMIRLVASYYAEPLDPDWLMDELGLTDHARTPYRRLSGGQQQRLSLAIAVIGRPELVFLDEPTAALNDNDSEHLLGDRRTRRAVPVGRLGPRPGTAPRRRRGTADHPPHGRGRRSR